MGAISYQPTVRRVNGTIVSSATVTGTLAETTARQFDFQPGEFNPIEVWHVYWNLRTAKGGFGALTGSATCRLRVGSIAGTVIGLSTINVGDKISRGMAQLNYAATPSVGSIGGDYSGYGSGGISVNPANVAISYTATLSYFFTIQLTDVGDAAAIVGVDILKLN